MSPADKRQDTVGHDGAAGIFPVHIEVAAERLKSNSSSSMVTLQALNDHVPLGLDGYRAADRFCYVKARAKLAKSVIVNYIYRVIGT